MKTEIDINKVNQLNIFNKLINDNWDLIDNNRELFNDIHDLYPNKIFTQEGYDELVILIESAIGKDS